MRTNNVTTIAPASRCRPGPSGPGGSTAAVTAGGSRRAVPLGALLAGLSILSGVAAPQPAPDVAPVAAVGSRTILAADLRDEVTARRRQDIASNRLDAFTTAGRDKALNDLIDAKLFAAAARDEHLDQQPDVARRLANAVDQFLAETKVRAIVAELPATDEALRAYYASHTDEFRAPGQVHARHIVVATRTEADQVAARLKAGADFAATAGEKNVDATKAAGGDLGLVKKGVMVQPFDQALFALRAGEMSGVVQTASGFHIIKAEAVEPGVAAEFSTVKDRIRQRLIERRVAEARDQLGRRYPVTIDNEMLAKVSQ